MGISAKAYHALAKNPVLHLSNLFKFSELLLFGYSHLTCSYAKMFI